MGDIEKMCLEHHEIFEKIAKIRRENEQNLVGFRIEVAEYLGNLCTNLNRNFTIGLEAYKVENVRGDFNLVFSSEGTEHRCMEFCFNYDCTIDVFSMTIGLSYATKKPFVGSFSGRFKGIEELNKPLTDYFVNLYTP